MMRKLTVNTTVWSTTTLAAGVELNLAITDDVLRKGKPKLTLSRSPLDDCLSPDAPLDEALFLDQATSSGVAPVDGFIFDSDDCGWMNARDRE